jgi:hypothetical protein
MVPADLNGTTSPLEHVYGSSPAKNTSPFTSLMTEEPGGVAKTYGAHEIEVDVARLQADIEAGKVSGVEIITPDQLQSMIRADIQAVKPGFDADAALACRTPDAIREYIARQPGISRGAADKLLRRVVALSNTTRDGEYLIRGRIPRDYIKGPTPAAGSSGKLPPTPPTP